MAPTDQQTDADERRRPPVVVTWRAPLAEAHARALAAELGLPLLAPGEAAGQPDALELVAVAPDRLELHGPRGATRGGAIAVDFLAGPAGYRTRPGAQAPELLVRAVVGRRRADELLVVDATAGLGGDAAVLASRGCRVVACERDPVVAALLADGLRRAREGPHAAAARLARRIELRTDDAARVLAELRPDVAYLDPMHPPRRKSALVREPMRLLQRLLGPDVDGPQLLATALAAARRRVVVKRPRHAPPLAGPAPQSTVAGRRVRFDVYPATAALSPAAPARDATR